MAAAGPISDIRAQLNAAEAEAKREPHRWQSSRKVIEILESTTPLPRDSRKVMSYINRIITAGNPEGVGYAAAWARKHGDVGVACTLLGMGRSDVLPWLTLSIDHSNAVLVDALKHYSVQQGDIPLLIRLVRGGSVQLTVLLTNMQDHASPAEWVEMAEEYAAELHAAGSDEHSAAMYAVLHGLDLPEDFEVPAGPLAKAVESAADDESGFRDRVRVFAKPLVHALTAGGVLPAAVGLAGSIVVQNPGDFDAAAFLEATTLDAVDIAATAVEGLAKGEPARDVLEAAALRFGVPMPAQRSGWRCW